jgi:hypothetical protein
LPRIHEGLVERLLATLVRVVDPSNATEAEQGAVEDEVMEAMKTALLVGSRYSQEGQYQQIGC